MGQEHDETEKENIRRPRESMRMEPSQEFGRKKGGESHEKCRKRSKYKCHDRKNPSRDDDLATFRASLNEHLQRKIV